MVAILSQLVSCYLVEAAMVFPERAGRAATRAGALAGTLVLAAVGWAAAVRLMNGMDMGIATRPGSFWLFAAVWVTMMAAMMLPGTAPAVAGHAAANGKLRAALSFVGYYLAIWAIAGVVAYAADR